MPDTDTVTIQLTLTVKYRPNGESATNLSGILNYVAVYAANNGMLTYGTDAEVDEWHASIGWPPPYKP